MVGGSWLWWEGFRAPRAVVAFCKTNQKNRGPDGPLINTFISDTFAWAAMKLQASFAETNLMPLS